MGVAKLRLFVAVELPAVVREHLQTVQDAIRPELPRVGWTRGENLHITIKFLGDTPEHLVKRVGGAIATTRADGVMRVRAEGLELFPRSGDIRIFSAGVVGDVNRLWALQDAVEANLAEQGYPREQRHYVPHITLARGKEKIKSSVRPRVQKLASSLWPGPEFEVRELVLMQSILEQSGARYVPLSRVAVV
jgi:RNA 2',3'-cyclic 3'-phosphodiesterase